MKFASPFFRLRPHWLAACLALASHLHAGTVLTTDATILEGDLILDNGITVRASPLTVKLQISSVLRARFGPPPPEEFQPGLVLTGGARITGVFSSLSESVIKFERKRIAIPGKDVAWVIYQPFGAKLAAQIPRGKFGALMPEGDFFEGTPRAADANTAKVLNPLFGPRSFDARKKDIFALILREPQPQTSVFEVLTRDGSIYPALDVLAPDATGITIRHPLYDGLRIPVAELVEIRASASRLTPLDTAKPARIDAPPGREASECFAGNLSIGGGPLKIGNQGVESGFESVTGAALWWKAPAAPGTFVVRVAAGPSTPSGQKVSFAVYAGGRLVGRSPQLGPNDSAVVLRCALPGAGDLILRVEGTAGSGIWAEPMLLKR